MDLCCVGDKYSDCGPSNNYTDNQAVAWDLTKAASCLLTLSLHTIPRKDSCFDRYSPPLHMYLVVAAIL